VLIECFEPLSGALPLLDYTRLELKQDELGVFSPIERLDTKPKESFSFILNHFFLSFQVENLYLLVVIGQDSQIAIVWSSIRAGNIRQRIL